MDYSPSGSSVHGIPQARILDWVTISYSKGSSWPKDRTQVSGTAGGFFTTEPSEKPYAQLAADQLDNPFKVWLQGNGFFKLVK